MAKFRRRNAPRSFNAAPARALRTDVGQKTLAKGRQFSGYRTTPSHRTKQGKVSTLGSRRISQRGVAYKRIASEPLMEEAGIGLPVQLSAPVDPNRQLPRTMAKLAAGEQLRVVVLGDSIVNDTFRMRGPGWGAIGKHYDSRITVIKSVSSDAGAWWYKEENRIQARVLDHKPDLVMIGGVSNHDDIESMESVVNQIRQASPRTEIVLMSAGANLGAVPRNPELRISKNAKTWRAALLQLAEKMGTGFIDFEGSYRHFVHTAHRTNPKIDHMFFQRDKSHTNRRGELLLGAILSTFFIGSPNADSTRLSRIDLAHSVTLWAVRRCKSLLRGQIGLPQPNTVPAC